MFVWTLQGTSNAASRKSRENTCWEVLSPLPTLYIWAWAFGHHSSRDPALIPDRCCAAPEVPWPSKPGHSSIWLHRPTIKYVMLQPWIFVFLNFGIPESKWWNILQSRWWVSELSGLFSEIVCWVQWSHWKMPSASCLLLTLFIQMELSPHLASTWLVSWTRTAEVWTWWRCHMQFSSIIQACKMPVKHEEWKKWKLMLISSCILLSKAHDDSASLNPTGFFM